MEDFFYLGTISKTFGYQGQVVIYLDTDEPWKYATLRSVFINIGGELLPYMIEDIQYREGNTAVVKFADVDAAESRNLLKAELYLPISELPPLTGNNFYFHEVIGFTVIDKEHGNIGTCKDFIDISRQPIMQIELNDKEILVPAIDEIFEKVDRENKTIYINAPEGLIDIYLS